MTDASAAGTRLRPLTEAKEWQTALRWADTFTRELPGDQVLGTTPADSPYGMLEREPNSENRVDIPEARLRASRGVRGALWSWTVPEAVKNPRLISVSRAGARLVGLDSDELWADKRAAGRVWSGAERLPGSYPWAHCYGGHQFGVWADQLGDGRAMSLGEVVDVAGRWELQLKGVGRTPYARFADGYAVRRSSIREFLAAEHLNALGIPTTRSLVLVFTDRVIQREEEEYGAVVTRLAPSWVRFGSFELPASRGDHGLVKELADYLLRRHLGGESAAEPRERYAGLLREIVSRTARMVARWQAAGFCHGVMNTDNMSVLGVTLDFGPYAFLDAYEPGFICNHSDPGGRYAFEEQPRVALWNLIRLAGSMSVLIDRPHDLDSAGEHEPQQETVKAIQDALNSFADVYTGEFARAMQHKMGLFDAPQDDDVEYVVQPFLDLLAEAKTDYTFAMRTLCDVAEALVSGDRSVDEYVDRLSERSLMGSCDAGEWQQKLERYLREVYGPRLRRHNTAEDIGQRMRRENPRFVLRNWVAQDIIERAAAGDEQWIDKCLDVLTTHAFDTQLPDHLRAAEKYAGPVPAWGEGLQCSCSS
ncbi:hypothetical protein GGF46_001070 [Coemansia sp. RSA 552]|nr:hypothetical protein GGF46_001070 [Coemansia sp. RSA 552]